MDLWVVNDASRRSRMAISVPFMTRKGYLIEWHGMTYLADSDPEAALGPLQSAACTYRIALGPRAGQKVLSLHTVPSQTVPPTQQRCVSEQGFSLHAEVLRRPPAPQTRAFVSLHHPTRHC